MDNTASKRIRFGEFELDLRAGELRRGKARIRLQEQPFQILRMLLERPGEVVTREEVQQRLWPKDTIVEFDHSIGTAIKKLRQALGDEAASPRYVETLPRRGFRFIYPEVVWPETPAEATPAEGAAAEAALARMPQPQPARRNLPGRRWRFALAVVAAVLLCAAGWIAWRKAKGGRPARSFDDSSMTQVTASTGLDMQPSLSPDGSAVAYSSDQNGNFEIYVKALAPGGGQMQLTSDGAGNFEPAWSPDGKFIAYFSQQRDGIWVIPALGGAARRLTTFGSWPAWSPDSAKIAFQSQPLTDFGQTAFPAMPPSTLWVVSAAGGTPVQLTHPGVPSGGHGAPTWSPDGKRIAFSSTSTSLGQIWSVPAGGGVPQLLVANRSLDPVYGPEGRYLYYSRGWTASWQLMRVPLKPDGTVAGNEEMFKNSGSVLYKGVSFSANGRLIAFSGMTAGDNLQSVRVSPATGEEIGPPVALTHDTNVRKTQPIFSPDGSKVAFSVIQIGAETEIWLVDADGKNEHPLSIPSPYLLLPGWLPGGQRLGFTAHQNGKTLLESFDLASGTTSLLRVFDPNDAPLTLSPDGKQVAYGSRQNGAINVWVAPLNGRPARQLTFGNGLMSYPYWTPDSKILGFEAGTELDWIPASGGEPVQLTADHSPSFPYSWSPDGDKLLFAGLRNGVWNLWWVSRRTRQEKQVTHYTSRNSFVRYPAWSPRGDQMVYEYAETRGNIWVAGMK